MTQTKLKFTSFADYLSYSNEADMEGFCELVDGELVELPPASEPNNWIADNCLTITLDMPPPRLIAEIVSPGKTNRDRDYIHKRAQYAAINVPEYWLIDPVAQTIMVLTLEAEAYREVGVFDKQDKIASIDFSELTLTAAQIFESDL